jgi:hypothetical protein
MLCKLNEDVWRVLFGAGKIHGIVEMGKCIVKGILELKPKNVASYMLLSNSYIASSNLQLNENFE